MAIKKTSERPSREPDDRVEKSRKAVLAATHQLLAESGLSGVSVDEVARRSGVAKTTIYRHWQSRESLLLDACSQLSSRPPVPNTGKLRTDLEAWIAEAVRRLQQPWATVMPSIIDAAERDKAIAELQSRIHAQMRAGLVAVIEHAQARSELPHSENPRKIAAFILGPIMYRRFISREPLDEAFAKSIVKWAMRIE
jgi:AcrR family transcriptional regulator